MSYLEENDSDILNDILYRKEYQLFKKSDLNNSNNFNNEEKNIIPRFLLNNLIDNSNKLQLHNYQLFVKNYINPNTPYTRLLLNYQTGVGKTIGALSIALNFINYYQKEEAYGRGFMGSVYIIGFTENIFKDELLKFPEFGFISYTELEEYNKFKKLATDPESNNKFVSDKLQQLSMKFKKRLTNRIGNGFFKFIGYKALSNHLFKINNSEIVLHTLTDKEILEHIKNGDIDINKELLQDFKNSLIICDEIHNVYNSLEKNSWGVALQTILNYHSSIRSILLSATPINNNPQELIDLLNLLLPRKHYPELIREEYFNKDNSLKKDKIKNIEEYLKGRISFIRNVNPKYFPSKSYLGNNIPGISFLKFIRCPMSQFHYNTYKNVFNGALSQDSQYLIDFIIPNPELNNPYKSLGVYSTKIVKNSLTMAQENWKLKNKISFKDNKITGDFVKQDEKLEIISSKYSTMLKDLKVLIQEGKRGKVFIYHNIIHMSGVYFIEEILNRNNIIGEFDTPKPDTLCSICGKFNKNHTSNPSHDFSPVRYIAVHSNIDKKNIYSSIQKFNSSDNVWGERIMILIGSRIMKESINLKAVQNIYIMSRPDNISMFIQIIGRGVRNNSHFLLPDDKRHVNISIYTSSLPKKDKKGQYLLSYEEIKYKEKVNTYKIIRNINKLMYENAIDAYFNYDIITQDWEQYKKDDQLDIIQYQPTIFKDNPKLKTKKLQIKDLNLSTFNVYHYKYEVNYITYIIKRLFIEISPVWNYQDLFETVKTPPFEIEVNSEIFSEELFTIALNNVLYGADLNFIEPIIQYTNDNLQNNLVNKLFDPSEKILQVPNSKDKYVITHINEYYMMVPIDQASNVLNKDTESIFRNKIIRNTYTIGLKDYLKYDMDNNYENKKQRFINKWSKVSITNLEASMCDFGIKFHEQFLEEIIEYNFNLWINPKQKKSEYHLFYVKMLYYYDLQKLIIWAHTAKDKIQKKYSKYINPISIKLDKEVLLDSSLKTKLISTSGDINLLKETINRTREYWVSTGMVHKFEEQLSKTLELFEGIYKKDKILKKVNADLLPIGHALLPIPKFFLPDLSGWFEDPSYIEKSIQTKENNIIIGYDERSQTGISVKFKIRSPIQNITKFKDTRLIEKGSVCSTKNKNYLKNIARELEVKLEITDNVEEICSKIRTKLIYNELKARANNTGIKWFYFIYQAKPTTL